MRIGLSLIAMAIFSLGTFARAETLFGEIEHSDTTSHVNAHLEPHGNLRQLRQSQSPAKVNTSEQGTVAIPQPAPDFNSTPEANRPKVPEPPDLENGYLPNFGVGHPGPENTRALVGSAQQDESVAAHFSVEWFMVPSWMAGTWVKDGDLTTAVTDLRMGSASTTHPNLWVENRLQATWGHQQDTAGNFWHVNILPSERDGQSAGKQVRFFTTRQKSETLSPDQLITRTHYVVSENDWYSGQPIDQFQQESLNRYTIDQKGELVNTSSNRVFTYEGRPVRDGQLLSKYRKVSNFVPRKTMNGIDLGNSLRDYLRSQGLSQLVP